MPKKKKKKKKPNKVIQLDRFREPEKEEEIESDLPDLEQLSPQELESLRRGMEEHTEEWKLVMIKLVTGYQQQDQCDKAWDRLKEVLEHIDAEPTPKSYLSPSNWNMTADIIAMILAARLRYEMKDFSETTGARYWIDKVYKILYKIETRIGKSQPFPPEWKDYIRELMTMASLVQDDQRILTIYKSLGWLCKGSEHHHLAGTAAFNLQQYGKARSIWKKMHQLDSGVDGSLGAKIALKIEKGVIPPFSVDYVKELIFDHLRHQHIVEMDELVEEKSSRKVLNQVAGEQIEEIADLVQDGAGWISLLMDFYGEVADYWDQGKGKDKIHHMAILLSLLITKTGEWGIQLGQHLLKESDIPEVLKTEINELLEEAIEEEAVSKAFDGSYHIPIYDKTYVLAETEQRADAAYDQGLEMKNKGKPEVAKDHILRMLEKRKTITPNVILLLSSIEKKMGQAEEALVLLEALEKVLPGNISILYNKMTAMMQLRKWQEALGLLSHLKDEIEEYEDLKEPYKPENLEKVEKKILKEMEEDKKVTATLYRGISKMFGKNESERRREIEEKDLPQKATLRRGLKNMPMEWLKYMWRLHKLNKIRPEKGDSTGKPKRADLEKEIAAYLLSSDGIKTVLDELEPDEKQLFDYLVERGGVSLSGPMVRKFGSMEEDGFCINEWKPPVSALGRLWSKGLVMVGRGLYKGKRQRIVLIPKDLLELL